MGTVGGGGVAWNSYECAQILKSRLQINDFEAEKITCKILDDKHNFKFC